MDIKWVEGFAIKVKQDQGTVIIEANKAGLLSLANQLAMLAEEAPGAHIHYDEYNSLENGSAEMIIASAL